ncbi:D-2-hydroxyacid dehydrogenase [Halorarius litoreus]|uniref:D-2-hydroxyacid dehydrogenase n=1 Tax=Halorarius litoreus TaxID=2962676 RepID=UPI0020CD6631|nr:D-2-hydroxyacid dehydrogenase [Halorarius litoreus]
MKLLVLREGVHGQNATGYATRLRERLPDHEIVHARTREAEVREIVDAEVVTGPRIDEDLLGHARRLDLFAGAYAGHSHLPLDALADRGVAVTNAVGVHAPNVAEHAVGSVLAFAREFREGYRREQNREWRPYAVGELQGSTVTVVGLGCIGSAIVERLAPFGVETVGVRANPEAGGPTDTVRGPDGLPDALANTDYLVLACPLTDATRGLVDHDAFLTLPADAVLVNVARGAVVDTDALVSALRRNQIRGAALDVTDPEPLPPEHPLWGFENVQVTPHLAGATPKYYDRLTDIVAGNVTRLAAGESLKNRVSPAESD